MTDSSKDTNEHPVVPCRLDVYLARSATVGVILRRGPAKWVQLIKWDTASDTFEYGQWFHGRIYGERCDVSPDGTKFVYCALKLNPKTIYDNEVGYLWTAVSKPPYLTALALWKAMWRFDGGGLFVDDSRLRLYRHFTSPTKPVKGSIPVALKVTLVTRCDKQSTVRPLHLRRLELAGWKCVQEWMGEYVERTLAMAGEQQLLAAPRTGETGETVVIKTSPHDNICYHARRPAIYERGALNGKLTLEMTISVVDFHEHNRYAIRNAAGDDHPIPGAIWADWDQQGRLVFVRDGKLFTLQLDDEVAPVELELADLNPSKFQPMEGRRIGRRFGEAEKVQFLLSSQVCGRLFSVYET